MVRSTETAPPAGGANQARGMETYYGHVRTPADAILLFEACRLGVLPRVQRRLSEKERASIRSGSVFVWDEREAGMRRWTDGKSWSASRVSGSFLTYREMEGKRSSGLRRSDESPSPGATGQGSEAEDSFEDEVDGYRYKPDGLMKQSFSITTSTHQKLHLISYYARSQHQSGGLVQPTSDPPLKHIHPPKGMYPDATSEEHAALVAQNGPRGVPYQHSAPANHYSRQLHNHAHHPPHHQYQQHYYQPYPPPSRSVPQSHYPYDYHNGAPPSHHEQRPPYTYPSPVATPPTNYGGIPPHQPPPTTLAPIHSSSMPTSPRRSSAHIPPPPPNHSAHSSPSMTHHHSPNSRYYNGPPPANYPPQSNGLFHRDPVPRPPSTENRKYDPYPPPNTANGYRQEGPPPPSSEIFEDSAIQTCMRMDDNRMKESFQLVL